MKKPKPTPFRKLGPVEQLHARLLAKRKREVRERSAIELELNDANDRIRKLDEQIGAVAKSLVVR